MLAVLLLAGCQAAPIVTVTGCGPSQITTSKYDRLSVPTDLQIRAYNQNGEAHCGWPPMEPSN